MFAIWLKPSPQPSPCEAEGVYVARKFDNARKIDIAGKFDVASKVDIARQLI